MTSRQKNGSAMISARDRVLPLEEMAEYVTSKQSKGKTVALCHGCFDILHFGHLRHFEAAKLLADILVVTVTPDEFVNKGPHRPVFTGTNRAELLAGLRIIDCVSINRWPSAVNTIKMLKPNVFVKGQEYETKNDFGFLEEVKAIRGVGGKVMFTHELVSSSTAAFAKLNAD